MAPTARYKSVWSRIGVLARDKAKTVNGFDAYFFKVCELVGHKLIGLPNYEHMSEDEKACWAEKHIWQFAFPEPNPFDGFPGDVTLLAGPLMKDLTMAEPNIREMMKDIEERKTTENLTEWQADNRRSEDRWLHKQLVQDGPVKFALFMEKIRLQRLQGDIEWVQNVKYMKTKIDGRPRFGVKLQELDGLKEAFFGPPGSLADVESALGIKFANTKAPDGHLVWATLEGAACLSATTDLDWEVAHLEDMLECAHEVLLFWKWCIELDHERGTTLMTLKQAYDLLMKEGSKLKALWMKDTGAIFEQTSLTPIQYLPLAKARVPALADASSQDQQCKEDSVKIDELVKIFQRRVGEGYDQTDKEFIRLVKENAAFGIDKLLRPKYYTK
ncbi:uncharacterized protein PAC_04525 [Phialocephala subalpina]|uniref:Uncharacterized protein n=1 Tax=Phialocephala subalpina TaxID=576137 RepID=A0A1L7WPH8_9HELO|nr:uncharacterized protein PAC_04525 [Phialocephala subalpina]